jgi:hypothetical protein
MKYYYFFVVMDEYTRTLLKHSDRSMTVHLAGGKQTLQKKFHSSRTNKTSKKKKRHFYGVNVTDTDGVNELIT